ncbi:hypothetical protein ACGFZK_35370 [Streptomyces sp. NPDC048257]|uniref:hypothetical protein n=1 Tax=Streptomyces sp. NPDC048257 TaxID=3365526 RepID=UPI003717C2F6
MLRASFAGLLAFSVAFFVAPNAQAATTYSADECTSANNSYCFALYYDSRGEQTWYATSSCFVTNRSIPDHSGYSPNGAIFARFVFDAGLMSNLYNTCRGASGSNRTLKNASASASNGECSASYRVYYNSGYGGLSQTFLPNCGEYWPAENLLAALKNENASNVRY